MEPGIIIFFYVMRGFVVIIILGFGLLACIRYGLQDKKLARNIVTTIVVLTLIPLLYRAFAFVGSLLYVLIYQSELIQPASLQTFMEGILEMAMETLILMIPMLAVGFLIAFLVVVPVTLRSRRVNK